MTSCRTYSPYGAWELKRTYQRNLLLANLCVVALVVAAIGIPSFLVKPPVAEETSGGGGADTVEIVVNWERPPVVIRDGSSGPVTQPPEELVAGIPVPMADSLLPEDAPPAIASQDELEAVYDYRAAQFDQQAGGGGTGTDLTDFLEPDIDEFVPVDIDPKMIHEVQPSYPRQARATGMEGDLWIAVLVGIDGTVKDVRLRKPSGIEALDLAATEAAWKNRFSPAIRGGEPIPVWATYKVSFRMNE